SMVGTTQAMIAQSRPGVLSNDLAMCAAYADAVETASMVTLPVSFLLGAADKMTPVRAAQPLVDAIAHAHVQIVPGVGHMVQVEAPAVTRTAIARSVGVHV
ncbi:alpha/beta hydrolase, partial [bacterium]|nr:alpha/beta hydrolase [bacterium]